MKFRSLLLILCLPFLLMYIVGECSFSRTSTSGSYSLSPTALRQLKSNALKNNDPQAAERVARYYQQGKQNTGLYLLWLRRASDLGVDSARKQLETMKNGDPEKSNRVDEIIAQTRQIEEKKGE